MGVGVGCVEGCRHSQLLRAMQPEPHCRLRPPPTLTPPALPPCAGGGRAEEGGDEDAEPGAGEGGGVPPAAGAGAAGCGGAGRGARGQLCRPTVGGPCPARWPAGQTSCPSHLLTPARPAPQAIHTCAVRFPDVAASVLHLLCDFLSDTNTASALDVIFFIREIIQVRLLFVVGRWVG